MPVSDSMNIALRFGSGKHKAILDALLARKKISDTKMNNLHEGFNDSDELYRCFIKETDVDALRSAKRDQGKPQFTTLRVPYSYAMLLSAHTYNTSVFLGRAPVYQFSGRHGEGEHQVQAVEALMDYQLHVGRQLAPLYVWMHDAPKYKFGVVWDYWDREMMQISTITMEEKKFMGVPIPGTERKVKRTQRVAGYEGSRLLNVSPFDYIPDPRVPISEPQRGEFVGRRVKWGWNDLVRGGEADRYFNLDVVKKLKFVKEQMQLGRREQGALELTEDENLHSFDLGDVDMKSGFEMVVDLIPKDWKLGTSDYPEKWVFSVVEDLVVIEARPHGALHNEFPATVIQYEIDGHNFCNRSMMEVLEPLNNTLDWLFNSHLFNVRAALNNQFVYDPHRVVTKDLTREGAGKLIRLKESAYGTDVRAAIHQLPVADVTTNHLRDAQVVEQMMQRAVGVTDNIMGMVNSGGRKSATEIRTSSTMGINRLKTLAEFWSAVGFEPLSQRLLQSTQQYYDGQKMFKVAGDLMGNAPQQIQITADQIAGFFDFTPVDGTMPVDRFAQANLWKEILMATTKMPMIAEQFDMAGIFEWTAQLSGLKNIKRFRIQVGPDQQIMDEQQRGNVIPLPGGANGRTAGPGGGSQPGRTTGDAATALSRVAGAGQVSGVGPTG
jgi:hypothetical protein